MIDRKRPRVALALGGGGLKGFAHIGVLRALEERGIEPTVYAGTSIGALVAASRAAGAAVETMANHAINLKRRDLFRLNHVAIWLERMRAPSIYAGEPLRALIDANVPDIRFDALRTPVLVNTVDVERGTQVVWGLPGLRHVSVADAVYASCALPGFFPPGQVDGRLCIDGGTIDNLPVSVTAPEADVVIAVDVGSTDLPPVTGRAIGGFASTYMRAATVMMHALQLFQLTRWDGPPMMFIRPKLGHVPWLSFGDTPALIEEGYRAACDALEHFHEVLAAPGGIFPRRRMRIIVDRDLCVGCGTCVAMAPHTMKLDAEGKAIPLAPSVIWSPADGDFVHHCPTGAISTAVAQPVRRQAYVDPDGAA